MKKGKLIGKILGIVLVFVMIGTLLPLTDFASQSQALAQSTPELEWSRTFGGVEDEWTYSVQQTLDGGYIIAGLTWSYGAGNIDVWLIKTDSGGNKVWDKTFGGTEDDGAYSVQQTSDGGYIVAGGTESYGAGDVDVWLIKTDSGGNKVWDKTFGGVEDEWASSVQQTSDGGYIIAGVTMSYGASQYEAWLIKTDSGGNRVWDKTLGGVDNELPNSVQQTSDGGYIVAGGTGYYGVGQYDVWLTKTDSSGNKVWDRTFGGTGEDAALSVQQTSDGGYIIAGVTGSYGAGQYDVWLIKTDSGGNKVWDKTFGGTGDDGAYSVQQISDGGYIIAGFTMSYGAGNVDVWLIKTDSGGNKVWDKTFGGTEDDGATSVQQTSDGGYIVAGLTESYGAGQYDVWLLKVPYTPPSGNPDDVRGVWDRVSTPSMKDWVLAPDFVIGGFGVGVDALYVIGTGYEDNDPTKDIVPQLLKSTDSAATWKDMTEGLTDEIAGQGLGTIVSLVKVACDFADPDFVAVALEVTGGDVHVFISSDSGTTFRDTGEVNATLTANGVLVFAVSGEVNGVRNIAIGGTTAAQNDALLYRCRAIDDVGTGWEDATAYDGWDNDGADSIAVVAFVFAPSWATDNTALVLTVNDGMDNVYLQSGTWGTIEAWNDDAGFEKAVPIFTTDIYIPYLNGVAGINTPLDYSGHYVGQRYVWVNVNYLDGTMPVGKIFRVKNKSVIPVSQQVEGTPWLTNVSYFGYISEGKAIASLLGDENGAFTECCEGVQVYRNDSITDMDICCLPWEVACKPPTGRFAMVAFYMSPYTAYAVALFGGSYDESAWSVSFDDGDTWNQLSLVNTQIDYLSDVAVSPDCNKTMLVSVNLESGCGCDSVWLKAENLPEAPEYSGQWMRTWCGQLEGEDEFGVFPERGLLRLAPEETTGDTVYLVDRMNSTIYWNELETLACWKERCSTGIIDNIVDLAVKDESTIYALDENGAVAMSDDHGAAPSWTEAVDSEVNQGWTIAVLGENVLVGGRNGDVSYSADGGESFTELENVATSGYIMVAFDSYFDTNCKVYATVYETSWTDGGVYRWVIDESTAWRDLKAEPSTFDLIGSGSTTDSNKIVFTGLVLANADGNPESGADTGGVLYASYVAEIGGTAYAGVARNLRPAAELCCEEADWDYLITPKYAEFNDALFIMMPQALKICGCLTPDSNSNLFSIGFDYSKLSDDVAYDTYDMSEGKYGTIWKFTTGGYSGPGEWDPWAYDGNSDGIVQKSEVIKALQDYFALEITKAQVIEVLQLYFASV